MKKTNNNADIEVFFRDFGPVLDVPEDEPDSSDDDFEEEIKDMLIDLASQRRSATLFRDVTIADICSVLISEMKPNALMIGPAGCGKTHIAEELAWRIRKRDKRIPKPLYGYRIVSLNLSDIVSGCGLVGDVERKVRNLVDYLEKKENKVILFIDEIHLLFGSDVYKKVAQILKPALSRGKFMVIAATTTQEVKALDEDPAFNRRFTRVLVDELTAEQTKQILVNVMRKMAKHYDIPNECCCGSEEIIVKTADEFCSVGSHRPDNALTLMDRVFAAKAMQIYAELPGHEQCIDERFVEYVAFRLTSGNSAMKKFDERRFTEALLPIKGQGNILKELVRVIKLHDMHVRPRTKPLTFLFAGPSGVGKSEVAKIVAREYLGEKPIVLNMAEFKSSASINRIIGAPAGYIGSDSNRELPFDALETNPYQLILLDEFEKCDRSVQRLFMSAFDEGYMKTNLGKEIDFSKSIIIATTNAGCTSKVGSIGFGSEDSENGLSVSDLAEYFDVELINRFTHKYTFNSITREVYTEIIKDSLGSEIAGLRLDRFGEDARDIFNDATTIKDIEALVEKSYDPKLGARPAKTVVLEYIDSMLLALMESADTRKKAGRSNICLKAKAKALSDKR